MIQAYHINWPDEDWEPYFAGRNVILEKANKLPEDEGNRQGAYNKYGCHCVYLFNVMVRSRKEFILRVVVALRSRS